ncbi:threonine--tRNA ligase [bacterium]|jgi:threonyl-tRNA synthetase|nr:threonine--tRNA ligase [bacterium]MDP6756416.1 threonine--tRNA ligase [Patescibacteria group bacterium]|tara:strand:- start:51 stop:1835 length:1785 start_codon:yes stop_codon:yes gene_type:complete
MSTPLETIRHSTAHLMAAAIGKLYPKAKFGVGPIVEDGFYYDIDLGNEKPADSDLKKIEKEMQDLQKQDLEYKRKEIGIDEAIKIFKKLKQDYKVELLNDLKKHGTTDASEIYGGEEKDTKEKKTTTVSVYTTGDFVDLCRGPHIKSTKDIKVFKLTKLAGAYWRGDEKNTMLTRIYGTAFEDKKSLSDYLHMLGEAVKRDHKIIGPKLDLFVFSDLVGPGLPLWTPKGTILREVLDDFGWELRKKRGYEKVEIPHITKKDLYEKSGHWDKFNDELFRIKTREGHEFAMKPMNCPHHTQIFDRKPHSYREMPQRYCNTTMCYRDEQTGELSGLSRTRAFAQDDAHVFCTKDQIKDEIFKVWDIVDEFYQAFSFEIESRLSLSDPKNKDAYLGNPKDWKHAEEVMRKLAKERGVDAPEQVGEAAFYGPKIDFIARDAIGREWQMATIQLDFNQPERFNLNYVNEKGKQERVTMIHTTTMGSLVRFISILIEHYAGAFPAWLAPIQIALLPVSTDKHLEYSQKLADEFTEKDVRVWIDESDETVGKKIRTSEQQKIPYILVIGDKEMSGKKLAVREQGKRDTKNMALDDVVKNLQR